MARKRFIFFDIDGTLLAGGYENSWVPPSTAIALEKLRKAGHFLALATGRSHAMAVGYLNELGFENMVSDGGYGLVIDKKLLGIKPLEKEPVVELVRECRQKNLPWALQTEDSDTRSAPDGAFMEFTRDTYMKTRIVPDLDPENYENIYKAYVACRHPVENSIKSLKDLPFGRYHETYFFVEPMAKAEGIRKMLDHFGAPWGDAIVFGDSPNDISMFASDWFKVAMGNAHPDLKKLADMVTADVDADGIYKACEKLGLFSPVA